MADVLLGACFDPELLPPATPPNKAAAIFSFSVGALGAAGSGGLAEAAAWTGAAEKATCGDCGCSWGCDAAAAWLGEGAGGVGTGSGFFPQTWLTFLPRVRPEEAVGAEKVAECPPISTRLTPAKPAAAALVGPSAESAMLTGFVGKVAFA